MLIQVYKYTGRVSRSVLSAMLVAEIFVDELPADLGKFARFHGGDFAEIAGVPVS